jgi:hypothetical protein
VAGTDLALFLLFPPDITELEASIEFEEKMDFCLKRGLFDGARSKSDSNQ